MSVRHTACDLWPSDMVKILVWDATVNGSIDISQLLTARGWLLCLTLMMTNDDKLFTHHLPKPVIFVINSYFVFTQALTIFNITPKLLYRCYEVAVIK